MFTKWRISNISGTQDTGIKLKLSGNIELNQNIQYASRLSKLRIGYLQYPRNI